MRALVQQRILKVGEQILLGSVSGGVRSEIDRGNGVKEVRGKREVAGNEVESTNQ